MTAFYIIAGPIFLHIAGVYFYEGKILEGIAGVLMAASFLVSFYAKVSQ